MRTRGLKPYYLAVWKWKLALLRYRAFRQAALLGAAFRPVQDHVYLWPAFAASDETELEAVETKIVHYLHNLDIYVVYFRHQGGELARYCYNPAERRVVGRSITSDTAAWRELQRARYCALWQYHSRPRAKSLKPWLYFVAEGPECYGTTDWLQLVTDIYLSRHPFPNRAVRFPETSVSSCAILGTGPSVDYFMSESDRWDAWIGANDLVCDERIWGRGRPFALCVIDPYFFSPTQCWKPMWDGAFRLLRDTPAVLVTSRDFAAYVELNFPDDIKRKCYYVTTLGHDTYRITTRFSLASLTVTPFGNVLTDLILPLAASISRRVILYGCDGRPPGATYLPKSLGLQEYDDAWRDEACMQVDEGYYSRCIDMFSLYTRFVVDKCRSQGVYLSVRVPSWNTGLSHLPLYVPEGAPCNVELS